MLLLLVTLSLIQFNQELRRRSARPLADFGCTQTVGNRLRVKVYTTCI